MLFLKEILHVAHASRNVSQHHGHVVGQKELFPVIICRERSWKDRGQIVLESKGQWDIDTRRFKTGTAVDGVLRNFALDLTIQL